MLHRLKVPGGCPSCASRCGVDSTHSLRQAASAGAKPNHGFFHCQHLRAIFFPPPPATTAARAAAGAAYILAMRRAPDRGAQIRCGKQVFFFHEHWRGRVSASPSDDRVGAAKRPSATVAAPENFLWKALPFRVAQADLRRTAQAPAPRRDAFLHPRRSSKRSSPPLRGRASPPRCRAVVAGGRTPRRPSTMDATGPQAKKKPAEWRAFRWRRGDRISRPRPRSTRRSRPAKAVRPAGRHRRTRARTASLRRRRPR